MNLIQILSTLELRKLLIPSAFRERRVGVLQWRGIGCVHNHKPIPFSNNNRHQQQQTRTNKGTLFNCNKEEEFTPKTKKGLCGRRNIIPWIWVAWKLKEKNPGFGGKGKKKENRYVMWELGKIPVLLRIGIEFFWVCLFCFDLVSLIKWAPFFNVSILSSLQLAVCSYIVSFVNVSRGMAPSTIYHVRFQRSTSLDLWFVHVNFKKENISTVTFLSFIFWKKKVKLSVF